MKNDDDNINEALELVKEHARQNGVGVISPKDGKIFIFSLEKITEMIEASKTSNSEFFVIFVKNTGEVVVN